MTSFNQTIFLIDQTITVGHNADGTKSFSVSASFSGSGGWSPGNLNIGGNAFTLTTIPRTSTFTGQTTAVGSSMSISINRSSSSFTHTLRYGFGTKSGTIATNVGASYSWSVPENFAEEMPSSTSARGTLWCDTYSGNTRIGTASYIFTVTVPSSMTPTLSSISLTDTNSKVSTLLGAGNFLQILSNIRVDFNGASSPYGGSIVGYSAEIVDKGQSTTSNGGTFGIMRYNGSITIRASVTDSRGRTSNVVTTTANVLEYFSPIFNFKIVRGGSASSELIADRYARIAPLMVGTSQKNQMTISFKVSPADTEVFSNVTGTAVGVYTNTSKLDYGKDNGKLDGTYAPNKSFIVVGTIEDLFGKSEYRLTVSTEAVVMGYDKDGRLAAGKVPELGPPGSIEAAGLLYSQGSEAQNKQLTQSTGHAIQASSDWNNYRIGGFYMGSNLLNSPPSVSGELSWKYVRVTSHDDIWCLQEAVDFNGVVSWSRTYSNGIWKPWIVPGLNQFYPVGAIYQSTSSTTPATLMGGTWERFGNGRVLVGVDESDGDFNAPATTGGAKTTSGLSRVGSNFGLPTGQASYAGRILTHTTKNTSTSEANTPLVNMQPYIAVYMWRRTA